MKNKFICVLLIGSILQCVGCTKITETITNNNNNTYNTNIISKDEDKESDNKTKTSTTNNLTTTEKRSDYIQAEGTYFELNTKGEVNLKLELEDIPKDCIQDAINEMYGLKGYIFTTEPYKSKFPNGYIDNMDDIQFNSYEKTVLDKLASRRSKI